MEPEHCWGWNKYFRIAVLFSPLTLTPRTYTIPTVPISTPQCPHLHPQCLHLNPTMTSSRPHNVPISTRTLSPCLHTIPTSPPSSPPPSTSSHLHHQPLPPDTHTHTHIHTTDGGYFHCRHQQADAISVVATDHRAPLLFPAACQEPTAQPDRPPPHPPLLDKGASGDQKGALIRIHATLL